MKQQSTNRSLRMTMLAAGLGVRDWQTVYRIAGFAGMPTQEGDEAVLRAQLLTAGFRDEISSVDGYVALARDLARWSNSTFSTDSPRRVGYWRSKEAVRQHKESESHYFADLQAARAGQHVALYISESDMRRFGVETKAEYLWVRLMGDLASMTAADALPWPTPRAWDPAVKARVVAYLEAGREREIWCGYSTCRLCGEINGSRCLTDGVWTWPEGLAHYVEAHDVDLPEEFVEHCLA